MNILYSRLFNDHQPTGNGLKGSGASKDMAAAKARYLQQPTVSPTPPGLKPKPMVAKTMMDIDHDSQHTNNNQMNVMADSLDFEEKFDDENSIVTIPAQLPHHHGKMTLVLDIDETLVHSRLPHDVDIYRQFEQDRKDTTEFKGDQFELTLKPGEQFVVHKRPGLDEFLTWASENFEVVAYTAALEEYASPLLNALDPESKYFTHRLFRHHCVFVKGHYVKDLRKINRNLETTVLVDNNAYCFLPQLDNGIPISSFYDDHTDSALNVLRKFLNSLTSEKSVKPTLRQAFNLQNLLQKHRDHILGNDFD